MSIRRSRPRLSRAADRTVSDERRDRSRKLLTRLYISEALRGKRALALFLLVGLALLPALWSPRVVPYRLYQSLRQPVYARVEFRYEDEARLGELREEIRASFPRYYRRDTDWMEDVFGPVRELLNQAFMVAEARSASAALTEGEFEQLHDAAESLQLDLSKQDAQSLLGQLRQRRRRFSFDFDVISPAKGILRNDILQPGILSQADFQRESGRADPESRSPRPIRIINRWGEVILSEPVGSPNGPISIQATPQRIRSRFDLEYSRFSRGFRKALTDLISRRIKPSLHYDAERTETEMQAAIEDAIHAASRYERGEMLMPADTPITPEDINRLRAEARAYDRHRGRATAALRLIGLAALLLIAGAGYLLYLLRFEPGAFRQSTRLLGVLLVGVFVLIGLQGLSTIGVPITLVPMGLAAGIAALIFGPRVGVGTASLLTFAAFLITETDVGAAVALLGSSWVFCCLSPGVRHHSGLLRAGLLSGGVCFLTTSFWRFANGSVPALSHLEQNPFTFISWMGALDGAAWIIGAALLVIALPLLEKAFGAATNVTLLELSDQEHPCLRQLVLEAPGTYHHSVVVGNLAEAAAEAIGANPLKARVGSYYHDIGKIIKPEYFTENDSGHSRHDDLAPTISALIIASHVKDGLEMGRTYGLPADILDIIAQHHGDSRVGFFYRRALEQAPSATGISEAAFRYPGPRPQTREAAVVLLADSVEAASRSLADPSPAHIERLVHRIVTDKLMDHQLDDSPLTFRDISAVEGSFVRTLNAMHHARISYSSESAEKTKRRR